jgi:hypothetical protein
VASRLLDLSLTVGMYPYPFYVQPARVIASYSRAFRAVFENIDHVLEGPYEPVRTSPPIVAADL